MSRTVLDEAPRPGFADELLARLAHDRRRRGSTAVAKGAIAGAAVTASVALLVATRRRSR
ncbi:MAG TPA: hypothetical protein VHJ76_07990 [Actinomycetota bacterium]|nr:hypothetical protein [Actinomycetota bacterium]